MIKEIKFGNVVVQMKATANTPKRYRDWFGRDLLLDMKSLWNHIDKTTGELKEGFDFGTIERLAYTMAKQYNNEIANNIDDWMDEFDDIQAFYEATPEVLALWSANGEQRSNTKKAFPQ